MPNLSISTLRSSLVVLSQLVIVICSSGLVRAVEPKQNEQPIPLGKTLFASKCARCHGAQGEGTKKHKQQLAGDLSVSQLAKQIRETMPEDDPESLTKEESLAIATFVHDAFYSEIARARNQPAKVDLARLTVRQYRQSVADLVGSFRQSTRPTEKHGLKGDYFSGRRIGRSRNQAASRVDSQVNFDFGTGAPVPKVSDPRSFSIQWNGTVFARETGEYEFVIRTEHAARLWINDMKHPLIDAWVKSGNDTQVSAHQNHPR